MPLTVARTLVINIQFKASCGGYAQTNNLAAFLAKTKSTAYVDLGAVFSHLSRSWQLVRRSVAAFVWAYPPHDDVTCGK